MAPAAPAVPVRAPAAPPPPPAPAQPLPAQPRAAQPRRARAVVPGSVNFLGMAALGATFAGFLSYGRNPDALTTAVAVVLTFFGTVVALYVLHLAFRLFVLLAKIAIPFALLLVFGNAGGWDWAEDTTDWLLAAGEKTAVAADEQWREWRSR